MGHSKWRDINHKERDRDIDRDSTSAWRCPIHGAIWPKDDGEDLDEPPCPMTIRRTIAGQVEVGICGTQLELVNP